MRANGRYDSSYERLAAKVSVFVSPENIADSMAQFFGTVVLACAIQNGDAHLKNFGILYDKPGVNVRLAPVYDMLSTTPYRPSDTLALHLDGSKKFPSRSQLIQFGRQACGLTNKRVETVVAQVAHGVEQACLEMEAYAGIHSEFQLSAKHLTKIFRKGIGLLAP